jgi:hypothetical protein
MVDRLIDAGVDPATAASLTGHSIEVMLKYYRQTTPEGRRRAVQEIARDGRGIAPGKRRA